MPSIRKGADVEELIRKVKSLISGVRPQKRKKAITASLHVFDSKEKDRCIAHCLEFDLVAEGATHQEARDNLADLIFSYLHFAMERNIEQFAYHPAPKIYWDKFKELRRKEILRLQSIDPALLKASRDRIKDFMREASTSEAPTHA